MGYLFALLYCIGSFFTIFLDISMCKQEHQITLQLSSQNYYLRNASQPSDWLLRIYRLDSSNVYQGIRVGIVAHLPSLHK